MENIIPTELESYFISRPLSEYPDSRIHPLSMSESIERHKEMSEYEPIYKELGLFPLDEAEDSNPYCYVSKTPMKGRIFHYTHDDLPLFKFSNIDNWVNALNTTGASSEDIDNTDYEGRIDAEDVIQLCRHIDSNYNHDSHEYSKSTVHLIQGLDEYCFHLIDKLSKNSDLFIREAVARLIGEKPTATYKKVAERLVSDDYSQVSRLAQNALNAMNNAP